MVGYGFKICRIMDGKLYSMSNLGTLLRYKLGKTTYCRPDDGPLTIFRDLPTLKKYWRQQMLRDSHYKIFQVCYTEYEGDCKGVWTARSSYRKVPESKLPAGTILCTAVTLLKEIDTWNI